MASIDMCEHNWPGSGCPKCKAEYERERLIPPTPKVARVSEVAKLKRQFTESSVPGALRQAFVDLIDKAIVAHKADNGDSVHHRHCHQGEYEESCKYGDDDCPAEPVAVRLALKNLLQHVDDNTCRHEDTFRGGSIWTFCRDCDAQWADDEGGFVAYQDAPAVAAARRLVEGK